MRILGRSAWPPWRRDFRVSVIRGTVYYRVVSEALKAQTAEAVGELLSVVT
jgi:hypothetical protein